MIFLYFGGYIFLCLSPAWEWSSLVETQIGIGGSLSDCAPATPPGMRVRTGRFEKLRS